MDPAKWATALEGGSRFGLELLWVMIAACVFAAFLQSLCARLGLATGKNLAQIFHDQYPGYLSVLLWLQCEISVLILDLTMVLGIAMTLNALLGIALVSSVVFTGAASILFLVALSHLGLYKVELLTASIMGVVLLCFSVEALHNNGATASAIFFGLIPKLKGDMLYIAAAIVGANIIPCSFYLHSALVQDEKQKQTVNYMPEILLRHSIVDIATGTCVTLLISLSVLSAAAAAFHNSGHVVITLQDAQALMEQVLSNSVAPAAFGFALVCAGELSSFSLTVAGKVATEGFMGLKVPSSYHRVFTRLGATLTALCLLWSLGSEGMYQVLIFSQIILALQLPLVIVPLLKVTSSQELMGSLKNSWVLGSFLWACTGILYVMNVWVAFDMLSGESEEYLGSGSWSLIRDLDSTMAIWGEANRSAYLIGLVGFTTVFTLVLMWMISAPVKADGMKLSSGSGSTFLDTINRPPDVSVKEETTEGTLSPPPHDALDSYLLANEISSKYHEPVVDTDVSGPFELGMEPLKEDFELPGIESTEEEHHEKLYLQTRNQVIEGKSDVEELDVGTCAAGLESKLCLEPLQEVLQQQRLSEPIMSTNGSLVKSSTAANSSSTENVESWAVPPTQSTIAVTDTTPIAKVPSGNVAESLKGMLDDVDLELLDNNDFDIDAWESLDQDDALQDSLSVLGSSVNSLTFEEPGSGRSFSARSDASEGSCGGSGSGSLSRLSGLGRSARKQFAALLDEFWGKLYDLHGQPVSQAHGKSRGASNKASQLDQQHPVSGLSAYKEALGPNSTWYTSKLAQKSWQTNAKGDMAGQNDVYFQSAYNGLMSDSYGGNDPFLRKHPSPLDLSEKRYSSLRYPSFRDSFDNQPATIHGYNRASYTGRNGSFSTGVDANAFLLERQRQLISQRSIDDQASPLYRNPTLNRSELENGMSTSSIQSYLSSPYAKQSMDRQFENLSLANRTFAAQTDQYDPYARSQWASYTGRDSAAWDPLVSRATGELHIAQYDQVALQKERDSLNSLFVQHQTGEKGYLGPSSSNNRNFKSQIERGLLPFDDISPSQACKDAFSIQTASHNQSLWATQPFEQLFGSAHAPIGSGRATTRTTVSKGLGQNGTHWSPSPRNAQTPTGNDHEIEVLNMLRFCIRKLLKLDGSEWLFRLESGSDEDLIATVSTRENVLVEADMRELHKLHMGSDPLWATNSQRPSSNSDLASLTLGSSGVPHCGEGCVWSIDLLTSFGVWCIHRVLELALMESRPELWGKYTYVLNRLQGVLDAAFSKPRVVPISCICVISETSSEGQGRGLIKQGSLKDGGMGDVLSRTLSGGFPGNSYQGYAQSWPWGRNSSTCRGKGASSSIFLDIIKDVETAIGTRKGRTGTAAGDVAFPKGKENLASVLKRYKRRLGNKSPGTPSNSSSNNSGNRRAPVSSPSIFG
ncbi:hypothetical protein GOP47_0027640 [Adiantum capillus-veneris]|nr:hypothetical protein GOP47_0027640 [Adiantum capillus-veneris]